DRRLHQRRPRPSELAGVDGHDPLGVQAQVRRIRAKEAAHVDVTEQRFEPLPLQRLEVFGPDQGLAAGLFDGLAAKETSLAERRADPGPLHAGHTSDGLDGRRTRAPRGIRSPRSPRIEWAGWRTRPMTPTSRWSWRSRPGP